MHEIGVRAWVAAEQDAFLIDGDVLNLLDRDEQQLRSQATDLDLKQIGPIDARAEAETRYDSKHADWRFDDEALAAAEPVIIAERRLWGAKIDSPPGRIACDCCRLRSHAFIVPTA